MARDRPKPIVSNRIFFPDKMWNWYYVTQSPRLLPIVTAPSDYNVEKISMLAITITRISTPATSMLQILTRRVRWFQCRRFQRRRLLPVISMPVLLNPSRLDAKSPFNSQRFNLLHVYTVNLLYGLLHEPFNSTRWRHLKWGDKRLQVLEITDIIHAVAHAWCLT